MDFRSTRPASTGVVNWRRFVTSTSGPSTLTGRVCPSRKLTRLPGPRPVRIPFSGRDLGSNLRAGSASREPRRHARLLFLMVRRAGTEARNPGISPQVSRPHAGALFGPGPPRTDDRRPPGPCTRAFADRHGGSRWLARPATTDPEHRASGIADGPDGGGPTAEATLMIDILNQVRINPAGRGGLGPDHADPRSRRTWITTGSTLTRSRPRSARRQASSAAGRQRAS